MAQKLRKNVLASIVLFAENVPLPIVEHHLKTIVSQIYQNKEIIVLYAEDRNDIDDLIATYSPQNCRFVPTKLGIESSEKIKKNVSGDVIFYKTCNSWDWYPRHIDVHLEVYAENRVNWVQSLTEVKDLSKANAATNVVDWRITPPKPEELEFDEISQSASVELDWSKIITPEGINRKNFVKQLGNGQVTKEISVVKWINSYENSKQQIATQLGMPIEKELPKNYFPTLMGNISQKNRNQQILKSIEGVKIESIIIKRITGMGDVILTEPVRRYLKEKYPEAKIGLMTSKARGTEQMSKYLGYDEVIFVAESELTNDALMKDVEDEEIVEDTNSGIIDVAVVKKYEADKWQMKIDLDLSYESRLAEAYIQSYFDVINVDYNSLTTEQRQYKIYYENKEVIRNEKAVYMFRDGSGWPGKTWPKEHFDELKEILASQEFIVIEHEQEDNIETVFNRLLSCKYYVGSDSGIMHTAFALGLKGVVIGGAAVAELTALPYIETGESASIHIEEQNLPCLGCKHKMFFEIMQNNQITFVSPCRNPEGPQCMTELKPELIKNIVLERLTL